MNPVHQRLGNARRRAERAKAGSLRRCGNSQGPEAARKARPHPIWSRAAAHKCLNGLTDLPPRRYVRSGTNPGFGPSFRYSQRACMRPSKERRSCTERTGPSRDVFRGYFGRWTTRFFLWSERLLARATMAIIAISDRQKAELVDEFRLCKPDRVRLIPLGLELDRFAPERSASMRDVFRAEIEAGDQRVVSIVGRFIDRPERGRISAAAGGNPPLRDMGRRG